MKTCELCGSNQLVHYQHPKFHMLFHECLNCEAIFKDIAHKITEKEELKVYNQHENSIDNIGYVNFLTNFLEGTLLKFLDHGKILDFGSGPAPVLKQILERNDKFQVEIYDYYYAKHEEVFNHLYDAITSTEVFEHLWKPKETLLKLNKSLKADGILAIMTLFHPKNQAEFFEWFYIRDPSHVTFYTPKTIEIISKQTGFKVIDTNDYRYITLKKVSDC